MNNALGRLRAVTFDVGGTLIEPWPSVGQVYASVAAEFGMTGLEVESLNRQFRAAWKGRQDFDYSRKAWCRLVQASFAGLCPEPPSQACFDAIYERFAQPEAWRIFDEVRPALERLRAQGMKLGVISNWDERLRPLLGRLGLAEWFEIIVVSHERSSRKPAVDIFLHAARLLNVPAGEILHVGDSPTEDVAGARAAGFAAWLLDRQGGRAGPSCVSSLVELNVEP